MKTSFPVPRFSYLAPCVLFLISCALFPASASAHVLKTDGTIGAVVHIDPDDDPIVNQPSTFYFGIKDKTNKFQAANCDCSAQIIENGKTLTTLPLYQNVSDPSLAVPSFTYTFPQRDVYQVKVIGKSTDRSFQDFTLTYDIRVSRTSSAASNPFQKLIAFFGVHFIHFLGAIVIVGYMIVLLIKEKANKKKKLSAKEE